MDNKMISGFEPFDASNWELAAERLWANFEARGIAEETPADVDILRSTCFRFVKALVQREREGIPIIRDKVIFGILNTPAAVFGGQEIESMPRILHMRGDGDLECIQLSVLREMFIDMRVLLGIDPSNPDIRGGYGLDVAVMLLRAIDADLRQGRRISAFGIYLPPHPVARDSKMWQIQCAQWESDTP